ncbi:MAG: glycosyl hydrolase 53 family protein [Bacteroidetes bacterium]|nr:glycosyl hydrolase 53 family protein [Bacteroidota bacterium]
MQKFTTYLTQCIIAALFFLFYFLLADEVSAQFVKGADIGWLQQMEATGYKFYDSTGTQKECLQILKDHGINTVRLRVWVNPSNDKINGHCSKKEVAAMALRAKNMGMRIMIDFHYSDSWADPGKQTKPAAWASHSFSQLLTDLYTHTFEVLDTLKSIGAKPDWAQIGNEIPGGMLWPDGSTSNWAQLAQLLNKGYDATRAVDSAIKVIIHLDQGNSNSRFRTFFDNAKSYNVRYDLIGASYYPYWLGSDYTATINELGNNLNDMVNRYGKEVMVVEVGGDYTKVQNTYNMLVAVLNKVKAVPNNKGLGVIYWEPEGEKSWSGYQLSCWGSDGKPTAALDAFLVHLTGINSQDKESGIFIYPNPFFGGLLNIDLNGLTGSSILKIFDTRGQLMKEFTLNNQPKASLDIRLLPGVYVINVNNDGRKITGKFLVN